MPFIDVFLPAGMSTGVAILLNIAAFVTAAMTAAIGIGGGVALLAIMSQLMPVSVLIPVHGVVQVGSNFSRALLLTRHAQWRLLAYIIAGCAVGAAIGGKVFVSLPDTAILAAIAVFILWSTWGRLPPLRGSGRGLLFVGGAVASVLTMFVGASGPFVIAMLRRYDLNKTQLIATQASAMVIQHLLKVIVFGLLGFAFEEWLPLMLAMVVSAMLGTVAGTRLLHRLPEHAFRLGLKIVLTVVAVELLAEVAYELFL